MMWNFCLYTCLLTQVLLYHITKTREKWLDQLIFKNFSWRLKQHEKNQDGLQLLMYPY